MRFFIVALATVAALTAATVRLVGERNRAVQLGYELAAASSDQRALEEELRQLRIDRAALLDPERLAPLAARHGLRTPSPDEIVVVAPPANGPHAAADARDGAPARGGDDGR